MTSLIDSCQEKLGIHVPQTVTIAWINDLYSVVLHHSFHMLSATDDLGFYVSLSHYRDVAIAQLMHKQINQ